MNTLQQAYRYFLAEPFYWIVLVFFQPARFRREVQTNYVRFWRRIVLMLRLALPLFLLLYSLVFLGEEILLPFYLREVVLLPIVGVNAIPTLAIGIVFIVFIVFVFVFVVVVRGIAAGIVVGISVVGSIFLDIAFVTSVLSSATSVIASGNSISSNLGIVSNIAIITIIIIFILIGLVADTIVGIVAGIVVFVIGVGIGIIAGISSGFTTGVSVFIAFIFIDIIIGIIFFIGYYRLPLYLFSGPSSYNAYLRSQQNPSQVFHYLQHSSLHWDERVYLRLPYLKHTLLIACDENSRQALDEIRFIDAERPQQLWAARATILELAMRDLEICKTLREVAAEHRRIEELFPRESKLMNPQWATTFANLNNVSLDAQRYTTPISKRAKQEALIDMIKNLREVRPNVAFRDPPMNARLAQVVDWWTKMAQVELQRLESSTQKQGTLDNPYKPGIVLQNIEGNTFVGRRDIAEQLESALRSQGNPPTFLLNGERRMGKTSTLVQLPHLLGSRYISVFYNLQSPGIYANTEVFLEWLAERLQQELQSRDIKVRPLYLQTKGESSFSEQTTFAPRHYLVTYQSDAQAYHNFNQWLEEVERLLKRDAKMVLLAFDEFEMFEKVGADGLLNLPTLFDWFRELIQFHPRIAILFSGVSRLEEMGTLTSISWPSYFINVRTVHIGFLRPKDAYDLITKPTELFPGDEVYSNKVVESIIQETGCHPHLVQATCSALIDMLNAERRQQATLQDAKKAIQMVIETWSGYFDDQWERTDQNQRTCLALLLAGSCNSVRLEQQSGLEDQVLRQTMKLLLRRDLVRKNDDETYEMTIPMFGRWIRLNDVV